MPEGMPAPLSLGQQRLWFLQQLHPGNPFYHYADMFRLKGDWDGEKLFAAFESVAQNHDILRTTFSAVSGPNADSAEPSLHQAVHENAQVETSVHDLRDLPKGKKEAEAERLAFAKAQAPFDLEKGPLVRLTLLRLEGAEYLLVLTMHHIIVDKWSMQVLRNEWAAAYRALCKGQPVVLQKPPIQYADYAHWQRQQPVGSKQLEYWKKKLSGELHTLQLPTDHARPLRPSFRGAFCEKTLPPALSNKLKRLAKGANSTMFVLMMAAYKTLLHRYSGQSDILVGTPFTNRDSTELEKLIGFFNDTLVMRSQVSGEMGFMDLLGQLRQTSMEAFANKNIPFETLVNTLKPGRTMSVNPLFQVMFLYHHVQPTPAFAPGLQMEHAPFDFGVAKFDLTLYVSEDKGQLTTIFEYATDLFERETIERMQGHLRVLLEGIADNPEAKISELPLLTEAEKQQVLVDWNDTKTAAPEATHIHHFIEKQARAQPGKIAVAAKGQQLTYFDLNKKAEQLAARLQSLGVGANMLVGLCTERSFEMITGILAILKAGAAYLPIDPEYPKDRVAFMLEDAAVTVVLAQPELMKKLPKTAAQLVGFDEKTSRPFVPKEVAATDLAYLIYTSGSTGRPKGVAVTHANLVHSTTARFGFYEEQPGSFLLLSSFAFDSSVAGIFWTLCSGGTLVLPEKRIEQDMERLADIVCQNKVTHTLLLPSLYALLLQHAPAEKLASLQAVSVAGEACNADLCKLHFDKMPGTSLYNEYGPTEATVWCIAHKIQPGDVDGAIPIGRPIANTQVFILDKNKQPVPVGVPGELYIGGAGIARGYLNRPQLTAQCFAHSPFTPEQSGQATHHSPLYRTGDLARYRPDGIIEFLGRADQQVKIRGYRIELNEIKAVLQKHPSVKEALVVVRKEVATADETERLAAILAGMKEAEAERLLATVESIVPAAH